MKKYNVGLIGAGFMGKAHSLAYAGMPMFFWPAPGIPIRKTMCEINDELAKNAADRFGFEKYTSRWQDLVNDPEIDVVDISTPNNTHAEIAIAAAKGGKHILCEKPLATTTEDALAVVEAVEKANVINQLAFNYRRVPAVAFAKKLIDEGILGKIFTYRGTYLSGGDTKAGMGWRQIRSLAGHGALGDIGTHSIDLARYLVGEFEAVNGLLRTFVPERPYGPKQELHKVENDDEVAFSIQFKNGAIGSIESGGNAWGRNNQLTFEIYGEKGAILFDYEHRDELRVAFGDDPVDRRGFRTISTGGPVHPYGDGLWPIDGIGIGYGELKIIECYDFFKAISENKDATPNFRSGYEISKICDAIVRSSENGKWMEII
jgi:predicted dehydrogenase